MQIGRKIYYDKFTGNVLVDTGEMKGSVKNTTIDEDFQRYKELQGLIKENVGVIQLEYGQYKEEFKNCTSYSIDTTTEQIIFDYSPVEENPTIEDINRQVVAKIRTRYSIDDEFQMQRLGLQDNTNAEYLEYLTYVNECVEWGRQEKIKYGLITG